MIEVPTCRLITNKSFIMCFKNTTINYYYYNTQSDASKRSRARRVNKHNADSQTQEYNTKQQ